MWPDDDAARGYCAWLLRLATESLATALGYCAWLLRLATALGYCAWLLRLATARAAASGGRLDFSDRGADRPRRPRSPGLHRRPAGRRHHPLRQPSRRRPLRSPRAVGWAPP